MVTLFNMKNKPYKSLRMQYTKLSLMVSVTEAIKGMNFHISMSVIREINRIDYYISICDPLSKT